ncbi:MAG TPA: fructosamine kinase family protein [Pseudonocardiaceae bacterium]
MGAAEAVAELLGRTATDVQAIGAGVFEAELDDGDLVVVKDSGPAGAGTAEAAGLAWLAEGCSADLAVPGVRAADERWVVMECVETGEATAPAAERLGRGLARLHATGAAGFGAPPDGGPVDAWIGRAPMRNTTAPGWAEFYAEHRVTAYLGPAVDGGGLTVAEAATVARAADAVAEVAGPAEPPARLHGDLWSGNVLYGRDGRPWLIDPAAHGGHRETDLAMLALFGAPHLGRTLAAYDEARPLADGWRDRVPLHQLFPLLVHVVLFGRAYAGQTLAAARSVLALR